MSDARAYIDSALLSLGTLDKLDDPSDQGLAIAEATAHALLSIATSLADLRESYEIERTR